MITTMMNNEIIITITILKTFTQTTSHPSSPPPSLPSIRKRVVGGGFVVVVIHTFQRGSISKFDGDLAAQHIFPPKSVDFRSVVICEVTQTLHRNAFTSLARRTRAAHAPQHRQKETTETKRNNRDK